MAVTFSTIAVSIFIEGLFFLLIGVLISSTIEVFVSEETLNKFIPKNKFIALLSVSLLGLFFPICECGIVPVVHRLLKKKVPLHICITLLFAAPIVNIVVILSTYVAFIDIGYMALFRFTGGVIISLIIGFIVSIFFKNDTMYSKDAFDKSLSCSCGDHDHSHHHSHEHNHNETSCGCGCHDGHNHSTSGKAFQKINSIMKHAISEFFDTSKYFIFGILITALIQSTVPDSSLSTIGGTFPVSNIFMLFMPYVLSICSNTDAFIARSFLDQFNISSLLCFMIFGAMFDIKTTIMLKKVFKMSFILKLLFIVIILTLLYSFGIEIIVHRYNL